MNGTGSTWTNSGILYVGFAGNGTLKITNGGSVSSNAYGDIGYLSGGTVTVDGAGSTWTNGSTLYVGDSGNGTLIITNGGAVTASSVSINSTSLLAMDVGRGSLLTIGGGAGTITNNGIVRLSAGAIAAAGTYTPILAGSWTGSGSYQALGGTWNSTNHVFTVSSAIAGTVGLPVTIDLSKNQRVLISDGSGKNVVGASFGATTSSTSIGLTAAALTSSVSTALQTAAGSNEEILSGWTFSTTNYTVSSSNPVYLSLLVGSGQSLNDLDVWHYDGTAWTEYAASDLSYDGAYADFTVTGFSGYAVSGEFSQIYTLPEPGTFALLAAGLLGLAAYAWRKRRK